MSKKKTKVNFEEVALATAKDLVEMSQIVRKVLSNSTFNYNVIDDVKLLESMTRDVMDLYTVKNETEKA